jgi:hypothetical protein
VKHWQVIAENLAQAGFSWGCVAAIDSNGRTIWIADAHRGDGKRFVVRGDEKLTALLELEAAIRKNSFDTICRRWAGLHLRQVRWASPQELHLTLFPQGKQRTKALVRATRKEMRYARD